MWRTEGCSGTQKNLSWPTPSGLKIVTNSDSRLPSTFQPSGICNCQTFVWKNWRMCFQSRDLVTGTPQRFPEPAAPVNHWPNTSRSSAWFKKTPRHSMVILDQVHVRTFVTTHHLSDPPLITARATRTPGVRVKRRGLQGAEILDSLTARPRLW